MGWWDVSKDPEIVTGDGPLDLVRRMLRDFAKAYEQDLSRKPTLDELEYALNLSFRVNLTDEIVSGFEELEIKQVVLKSAKRPKRQKPTVGDLFAFRVENRALFGFGRLVSKVSLGMVAEIIDYFGSSPILDPSSIDKWLTEPIVLDTYSLFERKTEGDWRIIGHTDDFQPGDKYRSIRFIYGEPPNDLKSVNVSGETKPVSAVEAEGLPTYSPAGDGRVQYLVSKALKKREDTTP